VGGAMSIECQCGVSAPTGFEVVACVYHRGSNAPPSLPPLMCESLQ
jgi:hypothetical protein